MQAVLWATPTPVCDLVELRFLISISCPYNRHRTGPPVLPRMASPACHPCHPESLSVGSGSCCQDRHTSLPLTSRGSATPFTNHEATSRFAFAATRKLVRPAHRAVVRELSASGYPLRLPRTTWVNYRIPMAGLQPASHTFYTAYGRPLNYQILLVHGSRNLLSFTMASPRATAMLTAGWPIPSFSATAVAVMPSSLTRK